VKHTNVNFWLYRTNSKKTGKIHPRWRIRYIGPDGKSKHATGFVDKGETTRLAQQLAMNADEVRRGIRKAPEPADTESLRPIQEHIESYLRWGNTQGGLRGCPWSKQHSRITESTLEWWRKELKLATLSDICLKPAEDVLHTKAADGTSGKRLTEIAGSLRAFIRWCMKRRILKEDPLEGLSKFDKSVKSKRRALNLDELGRLLAVTPFDRRLVYKMAVITGFRYGELDSLRVSDLDFDGETIRLKAEFAKNRQEALCHLTQDLLTELQTAIHGKKDNDRLLDGLLRGQHASRCMKKDLKLAQIKERNLYGTIVFHSLRHTHISLGIQLGLDAKTAQTLARHHSADLTMNTYAHTDEQRLKKAIEVLGDAMAQAHKNADNSRTGVERQELRLAAGGENQTYPQLPQEVTDSKKELEAVGIEPKNEENKTSETIPDKPASTQDSLPSTTYEGNPIEPRQGETDPRQHKTPEQSNRSRTGIIPDDLKKLADLWPSLPENARQTLLTLARQLTNT